VYIHSITYYIVQQYLSLFLFYLYYSLFFFFFFFFFNDTATTEIYTLSLHDALPILARTIKSKPQSRRIEKTLGLGIGPIGQFKRSEEHTSELQSLAYLVCRLLLEKKKKKKKKKNKKIKKQTYTKYCPKDSSINRYIQ